MPQVFVHGELIGGSDIALEMLNDGSLREVLMLEEPKIMAAVAVVAD